MTEWYSVEIHEHDHFYKTYEDYRNNLYILNLNDDIDAWIKENVKNHWDIDCEDYYQNSSKCEHMFILFTDEIDAMAFKLRWCEY